MVAVYSQSSITYELKPEYVNTRIVASPGSGKSYICDRCDMVLDGDILYLKALSDLMTAYGNDVYILKSTDDIRGALCRYVSRRRADAPGWYALRGLVYQHMLNMNIPEGKTVLFGQVTPIICSVANYIFIQESVETTLKAFNSADRRNKDTSHIGNMSQYVDTLKKIAQPYGYTPIGSNTYLSDIICSTKELS